MNGLVESFATLKNSADLLKVDEELRVQPADTNSWDACTDQPMTRLPIDGTDVVPDLPVQDIWIEQTLSVEVAPKAFSVQPTVVDFPVQEMWLGRALLVEELVPFEDH